MGYCVTRNERKHMRQRVGHVGMETLLLCAPTPQANLDPPQISLRGTADPGPSAFHSGQAEAREAVLGEAARGGHLTELLDRGQRL